MIIDSILALLMTSLHGWMGYYTLKYERWSDFAFVGVSFLAIVLYVARHS